MPFNANGMVFQVSYYSALNNIYPLSLLYFIVSIGMNKKSLKNTIENKENELPKIKCFNTKGYYDPSMIYHQEYINNKVEVFQKYRTKQTNIKVLDSILTDKQITEQRNMIMLHSKQQSLQTIDKKQSELRFIVRKRVEVKRSVDMQFASQPTSDKRINQLWKVCLDRRDREESGQSKIKCYSQLQKRLNTQDIRSRKGAVSQYSMRPCNSRQANFLKIQDNDVQIL